jgi:phage tail-like protein
VASPQDREVWNKLRVDLYRRLLPRIQEQDQRSGAMGFTVHWDDPDPFWDSGDPLRVWDAIGATPLYQELFYVIEKMLGEDVEAIESLDALVDPLRCPVEFLPNIASSFGYKLEQKLDEAAQRAALLGLIDAYKSRGTFAGFKVFYRLLGFDLIRIVPLWKKDINEANNNYSSARYKTTSKSLVLGASGTSFAGRLPDFPIKPGTLRITAGGRVVRDEPPESMLNLGTLIGPGNETGTIDYTTGEYRVTLDVAGVPTATWEQILDEWPYHAARIDIEVNLSPTGIAPPEIDAEVVAGLLNRLEETRPVHVILRTLALVVELRDTVQPGASDKKVCASTRDDRRADSVREYLGDKATKGEDEMLVQHWNGADVVKEQNLEDRNAGVCSGDVLKIETVPGTVTFW